MSYSFREPEEPAICECKYDQIRDRMDREDCPFHCDLVDDPYEIEGSPERKRPTVVSRYRERPSRGGLKQHKKERGPVKKKSKIDNVLPFAARPEPATSKEPGPYTAYFQIGSDCFAMHMWCESLAPVRPQLVIEPRLKKKTNLIVVPAGATVHRAARGPGAPTQAGRQGFKTRRSTLPRYRPSARD